jgi:hypothetical protein
MFLAFYTSWHMDSTISTVCESFTATSSLRIFSSLTHRGTRRIAHDLSYLTLDCVKHCQIMSAHSLERQATPALLVGKHPN